MSDRTETVTCACCGGGCRSCRTPHRCDYAGMPECLCLDVSSYVIGGNGCWYSFILPDPLKGCACKESHTNSCQDSSGRCCSWKVNYCRSDDSGHYVKIVGWLYLTDAGDDAKTCCFGFEGTVETTNCGGIVLGPVTGGVAGALSAPVDCSAPVDTTYLFYLTGGDDNFFELILRVYDNGGGPCFGGEVSNLCPGVGTACGVADPGGGLGFRLQPPALAKPPKAVASVATAENCGCRKKRRPRT